jgi:hypothetical protein
VLRVVGCGCANAQIGKSALHGANRSIILRGRGYGLCCAHGLAAIASVADRRDDGRVVPLEQGAAEEIFVREEHALRLQFSSVPRICPNDSIQGEERPAADGGDKEPISLQACFALRITILKRL